MMNKDILILGAGPAGMACAMELCNNGKIAVIIEKDLKVGGLAQTLEFDEGGLIFRTDLGPHRFFSKNQYLYDFIENLLNEKWILVNRQTRQFIDGKFYDYPINALQALRNIGFLKAFNFFISYISGFFQYKIFKKKINSFEDYIVASFGRKLGEFNMLNYTEKIWGIPSSKIHPDWAKQRIQGLNFLSAVINALFGKNKKSPKTLVNHFYYPQYGTGLIYETIAKKIQDKGFIINKNSHPTKIFHKNFTITSVRININGKEEEIIQSILVSSIPITQFIGLLSPAPPREVIDATINLKWRAQVYLFITLDKEQVTDDNWIYFPNKEVPFGRISEMKNFSKDMSPEGKTSLFIEFFVTENDKIWNMNKEELFELTINQLQKLKLNFFKKEEVRRYYLIKRRNVYPIYNLDYQKNLKIIKDYLDKFTNLYYIGRPGRFLYNNQDHSLEMGILTAQSILQNKKPNFEQIENENEYFEKGLIKSK